MPTKTFESILPASPEELFAWHARPGAFQRLSPPWQRIEMEEPAPVRDGSRARLRLKHGPFWFRWTAEHRDVSSGRGFTDVQIGGPFARWVHRHEFEATHSGARLRDHIDYELPGGAFGRALAGRRIERDLSTTFAYRHETTRRDLARHRRFARKPHLRIAVTGASGLVGAQLVPFLTSGGHRVIRLVRADSGPEGTAPWRPEVGLLSPEALAPIDAVIHLAGENIAAGRWTAPRKQEIRRSRVQGTRNLVRSLAEMKEPPRTLLCASAIGFYGSSGDQPVDEKSHSGDGFLAEVCRDWEAAALAAEGLGLRVGLLRFGIILTPAGGALAKLLPAFKLGAGGRLGDGRQSMSWVSIDDAIGAIHQALLDDQLEGPINVVAPRPTANEDFSRALGRVLRRPTLLPVPKLGLRLALGEMANEMLLASARVEPRKLQEAGFHFDDIDLERTLARLLGKVEWS